MDRPEGRDDCPLSDCRMFPTLAVAPAANAAATLNDKLDWFGTFRGRGGVP